MGGHHLMTCYTLWAQLVSFYLVYFIQSHNHCACILIRLHKVTNTLRPCDKLSLCLIPVWTLCNQSMSAISEVELTYLTYLHIYIYKMHTLSLKNTHNIYITSIFFFTIYNIFKRELAFIRTFMTVFSPDRLSLICKPKYLTSFTFLIIVLPHFTSKDTTFLRFLFLLKIIASV